MSTVLGLSQRTNRPDPIPKIRAAGHQIAGVEFESADYSIRQDVHMNGGPGTPDHLKKFRKSHVNQPGIIQKHYGVAEDQLPFAANHIYGKETYTSEHVNEVIKAQDLTGMQDKFNDIMESKYASHFKEPLGQSYQRGYNWPERVTDNHTFGVHTKGIMNAKEILYPKADPSQNDPRFQEMYKRTHGNYDPGE